MRAVVSTVSQAQVRIGDTVVGDVNGDRDGAGRGALLVLVGVGHEDGPDACRTMARKIAELRILPGASRGWNGAREFSAIDNGAEILVVSQFTLMGATAKGRRPSWSAAASREAAQPAIDLLVNTLRTRGLYVQTGKFGASMKVSSVNEGPFTVVIET